MKLSFWDILASMLMLGGLALGTIFINIFINPYSLINPFPPATPVATLVVPTLTPSPLSLPELWTATPEVSVVKNAGLTSPSATATQFGTHWVLPSSTATRTRTASPTTTKSITSTPNRTLTAAGNKTATKTATSISKTNTPVSSTSIPALCSTTSGYCDDANSSITYTGTWTRYSGGGPYKSTDYYSSVAGSTASFAFTGTKISYLFPTAYNRGNARITIDGSNVAIINLNSPTLVWQQLWDSPALADGAHIITITVLDGTVDLDAFIINRSGPVLTNTPVPTNTPTHTLTPTPADTIPPTNPTSVTETHGVADNTWQNNTDSPVFTWTAGADSGTGVSHYLVYFGTEASGTPVAIQVSGYAPGPQPSGTYYLRISTVDIAGNQSDPETLFTFKYDTVSPSNPSGVSEINGADDDTWQKGIDTPNFSLSSPGTDAHSGIGSYLVYFGNDNAGTPSSSEIFDYSPGEQTSGTYYLRVITRDNAGNPSGAATLFTFKFDNTPPTDPGLPSTNSNPATDNRPTFTWDASTDALSGMGGTAGYKVYWDVNSECGPVIAQFSASNSFTPPNPITANTPYYICVRAVDALGNEGPWGAASSFMYTP